VCGGVAIFFAVSLVLTFFAKGFIIGLAQDFVIVKTQQYADPVVEVAERAVQRPELKRVLDPEILDTARNEITDYRRDPRAYIEKLAAQERRPAPAAPGRDGELKDQVLRWKANIQAHFDRTMNRLIWDLRIFSGSNLVAALIACWCTLRAPRGQQSWLLGIAALLLLSVAYGTYMYIDKLNYFRILFNSYLGWWYPVLLAITFISLYRKYGPKRQSAERKPAIVIG
jgi:hypothetical protein